MDARGIRGEREREKDGVGFVRACRLLIKVSLRERVSGLYIACVCILVGRAIIN